VTRLENRLETTLDRGFDGIGARIELLIAFLTRTGGVSPTGG
jgi:hypothetical protein